MDEELKRAKREIETCAVADGECTAPAAWGTSGGYYENTKRSARCRCSVCFEAVCSACSKVRRNKGVRERVCNNCDFREQEL